MDVYETYSELGQSAGFEKKGLSRRRIDNLLELVEKNGVAVAGKASTEENQESKRNSVKT